MDRYRRSLRIVALAAVVALPLLGTSGIASAKGAAGCHKTKTCKSGGGSGTGGAPAPITVQVDPNPLVETGTSLVVATIQVETSPAFAGDEINIDSSQLSDACYNEVYFISLSATPGGENDIQVPLDNDGNATVTVIGYNCAPGSSVIEADLISAPYYTALTTLVAEPPVPTTPGLFGFPTTSGTVKTGEVETGDTNAHPKCLEEWGVCGEAGSDVYAVFYVETDAVYAEQEVEISSAQLQDRCGAGAEWYSVTATGVQDSATGSTAILDDDGNAVFVFLGASCGAGASTVIADVEAGTHPTYTTTFNINPPQPTI